MFCEDAVFSFCYKRVCVGGGDGCVGGGGGGGVGGDNSAKCHRSLGNICVPMTYFHLLADPLQYRMFSVGRFLKE